TPQSLVIGADQVLAFRGQAIGKVSHRDEARAQLEAFAGQRHELLSAYCLVAAADLGFATPLVAVGLVEVPMQMRPLTAPEIESYLDTGEWQGTVGCYQFENRGVNLFTAAGGDSSAIIGL